MKNGDIMRIYWQEGRKVKIMTRGTGSGKARTRTRVFGDVKKHNAVTEYHKGKCISVVRYEIKNSDVDKYVASVLFEHKYAGIINSVISQVIMPYGVNYDVFLKSAKDRRYVMACVSMSCDYEDIGIKNCFNLGRKLVDLIMRQIEREKRQDDDLDLDSMINDRMDEIKTNTNTFLKFEINNVYRNEAKEDDKAKDINYIKKSVIDELIKNLKKLKKDLG